MIGRLFQIVYLLMEKESISAKELAEKLEVSVRTINRDIEKLSEARIPIYTTRGRNGGISLLPDYVLNKKLLTEEEKSGILSSMRLMGTVAYEDEKQALTRLEEFFGEVAQDWIEIQLDNWGEGVFDKERFGRLKTAILTHKKVQFDYVTRGESLTRTVRPCKLVFRSQAWYLYGYCELREDFRYFKFHRMKQLWVLQETFEPMKIPQEEPYYQDTEPEFEAVVAIDAAMAYRVGDEMPLCHAKEENGKLIFTIPNAKESWFYSYLLSYGPYAAVLEPEFAREKMKHWIEEMGRQYG